MDIANQFVHCCIYCNLGTICVKIFSVLIITFVLLFLLFSVLVLTHFR